MTTQTLGAQPSELSASLDDLLSQVAGDDAPALELLRTYYRGVLPDDLAGRPPAELRRLAEAHRDLAARRAPGQVLVQVAPAGPRGATAVDVVHDDMPFLVDSLTAELTRQGRALDLVLHPRLAVRRDASGALLAVAAPDATGDVVESWIHLELERPDDDAQRERLASDLHRVLADVRAVAQDEPDMRAAARRTAEELETGPRRGDPDVGEARNLLRWLVDDRFTFLGSREVRRTPTGARAVPGSERGLLRPDRRTPELASELPERGTAGAVLQVAKLGVRSTVHRPAYLDAVVVAPDGVELQIVGLLAPVAYTETVHGIPVIRRTVAQVLELAQTPADTHTGRELLAVLETFPRDELFATPAHELASIATSVLRLRERRQLRAFVRRDERARYVSVLVYLPRDRYTTRVRQAMTRVLQDAYGAPTVDYTARVSESVLARVYFVVRAAPGQALPDVDARSVQNGLAAAARSWDDELADAAAAQLAPAEAAALLRTYGDAFPEAYKEDHPAAAGLTDALRLAAVQPGGPLQLAVEPDRRPEGPPDRRRVKLFRAEPLALSQVLPVLQSLGLEVLDERPYGLHCGDGRPRWIYDFGVRLPVPADVDAALGEAVLAVWSGRAESDPLNALVTRGGLSWRQVGVLRAYAAYLRQALPTFSPGYVQEVLLSTPDVAQLLVALFEARFDPATADPDRAEGLVAQITAALDAVESLDADRILRALLALVLATLRTSAYRTGPDGQPLDRLSLKLDPQRVPSLPEPRPRFEIYVHSPRVEGVHLRFGAVARGGLRWSDRREDFRTEVLGLVKAQMVKNAVIVPTGAKGGFVAKRLPDPAVDRDGWLAEGVACYRAFVAGLLDVTDNLVDGAVVPPPGVVRQDPDDPYLVVAADKGTATFSDLANEVAATYGFWLGDAFASGGSAGYDHKAMGITARGAWESVKRHFAEMGVDPQTDEITVVGVGDMSGDVFGNGMLLSDRIRLVAAFDHRHVFLDPDPDPALSYRERRRLFALPRSSWADYDPALLSPGGGVHPRTAKSVPVSPQVRARLGLPDDVAALTPAELMRAVLTAPVDLLWNGGIGTYVKATTETSADVGDKANDAIRVDGVQLRARVVGEGGNLGLTQLGRVEYALTGGRINTDAIDNSAGVDTSDHEVNFKILLTPAVRDGRLSPAERDRLLAARTGDVAELVLAHNRSQNRALGIAREQAPSMLPVHARLLRAWAARGELDPELEHLPGPAALEQRAADGRGLVSSELCVLLAYAKITLSAQVLDSRIPEDPWFARALRSYFPPALLAHDDLLPAHRLRREITTTTVVNEVVDTGGITYVFRAIEETGATPAEVVRAFAVTREVFRLAELERAVADLPRDVPTSAGTAVLLESRRLLDRGTRWLLQARRTSLDVTAEVARFGPPLAALSPQLPGLLTGTEAERLARRADELAGLRLPADLALRTACLLDAFSLLDVVEIAAATDRPADEVARLYFALSSGFDVDTLLTRISALPRTDRWQALARSSLRYDLYAALAGLVQDVLQSAAPGTPPETAIAAWADANAEGLTRARSTLGEALGAEPGQLAPLSVALRTVRSLLPS